MDSIEVYRNSSIELMNKVPKKIYSWVVILIVSSILVFCLSTLFRYKKYLTYEACIKNGHIEFYVDNRFFSKLSTKDVVVRDNQYQYTVVAIEEYSYNMGKVDYWKVVMDANVPNEWIIENNRLELNFLEKETTFAESIINRIKKGFE